MKKIMFNDKYGLTQAVLDGRKTMTRRIINQQTEGWLRMLYDERYDDWHRRSPYMYLETLAIAQSYRSILQNTSLRDFVCQIEYDGDLFIDEFENITDYFKVLIICHMSFKIILYFVPFIIYLNSYTFFLFTSYTLSIFLNAFIIF